MSDIKVLALDLEYTLISNAVSQFPRHWLRPFSAWAAATFPRIALFTAVQESLARNIINTLARTGDVPPRFVDMLEYVDWPRGNSRKDLRYIRDAVVDEIVLVDDDFDHYGLEEQRHRWIEIPPMAYTVELAWYDDTALMEVKDALLRMVKS